MSNTSIKARLAMAQAFAGFMDSGERSATVVFYTGTPAANTETAADPDKKLVTLTFPEPCFKEVTLDFVELHPTDTATVIESGQTTWARIYNGAGDVAADLTVGTDITLANTNLVVGGTLSIQSIKLRP
ncbi:hypothetical protein VXQ92_04190 [Acinetobacter sp. 228]|uniref:hypothetical protein n=1 Tax=Acinetobacter sp. 228 TaxID=3114700 RepID=UPI003A8BC746